MNVLPDLPDQFYGVLMTEAHLLNKVSKYHGATHHYIFMLSTVLYFLRRKTIRHGCGEWKYIMTSQIYV